MQIDKVTTHRKLAAILSVDQCEEVRNVCCGYATNQPGQRGRLAIARHSAR
jgi:hypothetical protein